MTNEYNIVVRSDTNYDNLIAEITFSNKQIGLIMSQETSREIFDISLFSLVHDSRRKFYDTEKVQELSVNLELLLEAIESAKVRLQLLDIPRSPE